MRRAGQILLLSLNLLLACTTTAPTSEPMNEVKAPVLVEPKAEIKVENKPANNKVVAAIECPISDVICPMNFAPVVCSAGTYEGKEQPLSTRLMVWGSNVCVGRLRLNKEACSRKLLPSKLGDVRCVPDATGGHCPGAQAVCKESVKPSVCTATSYAGQTLTEDQKITGRAKNECLARAALRMTACRANLDPDALGDIECRGASGRGGQ